MRKFFDCDGLEILLGEKVIYEILTEHLLKDLPEEDQQRLKSFVGKETEVLKLDDEDNFIELEFEYKRENEPDFIGFVSIWVEPECVRKVMN